MINEKKNRVNRNGLLLTYFFGKTNKILRGANRAELDTIRYIFIAYVTQHAEISRTKRNVLIRVETLCLGAVNKVERQIPTAKRPQTHKKQNLTINPNLTKKKLNLQAREDKGDREGIPHTDPTP